jgi:predicted PurR-regulated permease PerM
VDKRLFFTLTFALLLGAMLFQLYLIFEPFFSSLLWAGILVTLSYPWYKKLLARMPQRPEIASLLMCTGLTLLLLLPATLVLVLLFQDLSKSAINLSNSVQKLDFNTMINHPLVVKAMAFASQYVDLSTIDLRTAAVNTVRSLSEFMLERSRDFFAVFSGFFVLVALIEINMFFLFRDGRRFVQFVGNLIPVAAEQKNMVIKRVKEVINASIYGSVVTAAVQGGLGGIAFIVLGLPSAILWGVVMMIMSFLPLVGPFVIWMPAAAWLFFDGHPIKAIMLVLWGVLVIGTSDNILRPLLISSVSSEGNRLNTLVLFLSVLGGIKVFGFLGIVLAPLAIVFTLTLLELMQMAFKGPDMALVTGPEEAPTTSPAQDIQPLSLPVSTPDTIEEPPHV